ncbi:hypothetical protein A2627_00905 [Candidatus Woesebacteria bacterium RIFCSPHIGHO2_01_FULL_39_28]|uniref:Resolvase/invertase-type recombinase catalytic domain-containing protein n=1 Tax=Candidatus Woesebacteria bacterium RIFCSPHIGHO2_01_FULL_39_28 TaxID=1802496 RepID=A0A1F7YGV1_9BACT|nr:MAG: hypothetical protein A2627_00905 [Candidatus Woesebacteria bacterium RIFCSPHIGHO2_01_FULL_39_28]OGM58725.1 MAG: hypothetical protein A3A50_02955 [Candidatus Woesebacteria bacterium RIFCSPLOWO2_01_FULL_38_20]
MDTTTGHIRAAIYTRVSTQEQAKENKTSLPEQLAACKKVCIEKGWEIIEPSYEDAGISGHLLEERLGLQKMLADAKAMKFDLVVVKDFDRLARSKTKASQIRDALKKQFVQTYSLGTPIEPRDPKKYDPMDDDLGLVVEGVSDFMNEIERNKIRRRMMLAKNAIATSGKIPNQVPFGYKVIRTLDEHGKISREIVVDEEKAEIVRRIFQMSEAGSGKRTIALQFNQDGVIPPRKGSSWSSQAISYILRNKTYAGYVRWGWRHADYEISKQKKLRGHEGIEKRGNHTAIVDEKLFDRVQIELKKRRNSYRGRAQMSRGLLTGIAKCIRCGYGVTYCRRRIKNSKRNPNWKDIETAEYRCGGTMYGKIKCSQRVMSASKLEESVISQLKNYLNSPAMKKMISEETSKPLGTKAKISPLSRLEEELNKIPQMKLKQQEAFERGFITIEDYGEIIGRLKNREKDLRADIAKYSESEESKESSKIDKQEIWKAIKDFDGFWKPLDFLGKKQFLRKVLDKVVAGNNRIEVYFSE